MGPRRGAGACVRAPAREPPPLLTGGEHGEPAESRAGTGTHPQSTPFAAQKILFCRAKMHVTLRKQRTFARQN
jgi:hypothetical protein